MLINLPPELVHQIISFLPPQDVCQLRLTNSSLRNICDSESIWSSFCKEKYGLNFAPEDELFSAKSFFQKILHRYGSLIGLWQRQNLKFYGGILRVRLESEWIKSLVVEHLFPATNIFEDLRRKTFLTIRLNDEEDVVITNHDNWSCQKPAELHLEEEEELSITIPSLTDYISSPAEWRDLLDEFRSLDTTLHTDGAIMKFVSYYHNRNMFVYQPLLTSNWIREHHGDHVSNNLLLSSLTPGVFQGTYGSHGIEIIHLFDGQGVKITGDPNIPFNEVSFRVTNRSILNIPTDLQTSCRNVKLATENCDEYFETDLSAGKKYDFLIPEEMLERDKISWRSCQGRWVAEAHIAGDMFVDDQFIPANFILFNQDQFAVMFLDLNCITLFNRVNI